MSLSSPVSKLARRVFEVEKSTSIGRAVELIHRSPVAILAITKDGQYVGSITESSLRRALESSVDENSSIEPWMEQPATIKNYQSGAEALRQFSDHPGDLLLIVIDDDQHVWGAVAPSDLASRHNLQLRPTSVGGLATPIGVYLTTGSVSAGPVPWGLMLTGVTMMLILGASLAISNFLVRHSPIPYADWDNTIDILVFIVFGIGMRLLPLAGIHAAEHMTVHAIEREEPLTIEVVSRMPRVHPRCGTNYAVGAMLFIVLGFTDFGVSPSLQPVQLLIAVIVTALYWRRIGGFVQYWVTTKTPTRSQIQMGITTGKALLEKFPTARNSKRSLGRYIWQSGMPYVAFGGWASGSILAILLYSLHINSYFGF